MVSLAKACKEALGVEVPKELQRSDWTAPALSPEQIADAARDALLVLALHQVLDQRLRAARTVRGFSLVRNCTPAIAQAIAQGVLLDRDRHRALVEKWTAEPETAQEALRGVLGAEVNPDSPLQLGSWLAAHLEPATRASWPTTDKGQLATDTDTLEAFADVPLVRPLLEFRRVAHRAKTWGETYQRHVTPDGRIHPGFLLLGARSGGMSCRSPNVKGWQMPALDHGPRSARRASSGRRLPTLNNWRRSSNSDGASSRVGRPAHRGAQR
jgi:DNA polymerase I-like protein with 3'-5' exonuclease and polymerase domains